MEGSRQRHQINFWSTSINSVYNSCFLLLLQFLLLGSCRKGGSVVVAFELVQRNTFCHSVAKRGLTSTTLPRKMTADSSTDASSKSATTTVTNRLFLSHIDYTNHDQENGTGENDLSPEQVRQELEELFSKFGSVLEIYLSDKEDPNMMKDKAKGGSRPPFGFVAMETSEEAQAALQGLGAQKQQPTSRRLFRDVAPANVHKSKNNKQNKNERRRSERLKEYRSRSAAIDKANVICQVHTSHVDRLQEFALSKSGVSLVSSVSAPKGTSLLFLSVNDSTGSSAAADSHGDHLVGFSQSLWDTWFVAPNLNRVTLLNNDEDSRHRIQGNIRNGVVPEIFRSLSEIETYTVSLRVAIFPPKLQRALLEGLEDYNQSRKENDEDCCKNMDISFSPGNPTHTISIVQVHPGVVPTPKSKGDNDKALYALGRLEVVPQTRKRSLSENSGGSNAETNNNKFRFQQQRTSQVPQQQLQVATTDGSKTTAHNSNLKAIDGRSTTPQDGNGLDSEDEKSISRAYWKLQEAWERYQYETPSLLETNQKREEPMWALDCGAAPGGWTKFLFRPGIVDRIYAVDPGKLAHEVSHGLDEAAQRSSSTRIVRHVAKTIQKALPELASELKAASATDERKNPCLDIWVSDMCVKDMEGQIDCFLEARSQGVVGPGTFFVLTLKCTIGYSATAFDQQTKEQVERLGGISRDVHVVHLFSNRSSERTVIGYLV